MITTLIVLGFFSIGGICNAIMDVLQFRYEKSIFKRWPSWDPKVSWENKWKMKRILDSAYFSPEIATKKPWYYLGAYKPKYVERFPFSSTALVFLTDPWHFFKWMMNTCFETGLWIGVLGYKNWMYWWLVVIGVVLLKVVRGISFTLFFDHFLLKRD